MPSADLGDATLEGFPAWSALNKVKEMFGEEYDLGITYAQGDGYRLMDVVPSTV